MRIHSIVRRNRENPEAYGDRSDVFSLQQDVNQLFNEFFGWGDVAPVRRIAEPLMAFRPHLDMTETEKEIKVAIELPGLTEKEVSVKLEDNILTIKGEKKAEMENKTAHSYRIERSYGEFERVIPITAKVAPEAIKAVMKNGVLTVTLPKAEPDKAQGHTIQVKAE